MMKTFNANMEAGKPVLGGVTLAAGLGELVKQEGPACAVVTGNLIQIAGSEKRGTVRLGLETLVSVLLSSGAVKESALAIALADAVKHDNGQPVNKSEQAAALVKRVKAAIAGTVPTVKQDPYWKLENGLLIPAN